MGERMSERRRHTKEKRIWREIVGWKIIIPIDKRVMKQLKEEKWWGAGRREREREWE